MELIINKDGLIRIFEAIIAILIILSALIIIVVSKKQVQGERDLTQIIPPLLEEVAKNLTLRKEISFNYNLSDNINEEEENLNMRIKNNVGQFIWERLKSSNLNFSIEICKINVVCSANDLPRDLNRDIFSYERVISTDFDKLYFEPRRVKMFLWRNF